MHANGPELDEQGSPEFTACLEPLSYVHGRMKASDILPEDSRRGAAEEVKCQTQSDWKSDSFTRRPAESDKQGTSRLLSRQVGSRGNSPSSAAERIWHEEAKSPK